MFNVMWWMVCIILSVLILYLVKKKDNGGSSIIVDSGLVDQWTSVWTPSLPPGEHLMCDTAYSSIQYDLKLSPMPWKNKF